MFCGFGGNFSNRLESTKDQKTHLNATTPVSPALGKSRSGSWGAGNLLQVEERVAERSGAPGEVFTLKLSHL